MNLIVKECAGIVAIENIPNGPRQGLRWSSAIPSKEFLSSVVVRPYKFTRKRIDKRGKER